MDLNFKYMVIKFCAWEGGRKEEIRAIVWLHVCVHVKCDCMCTWVHGGLKSGVFLSLCPSYCCRTSSFVYTGYPEILKDLPVSFSSAPGFQACTSHLHGSWYQTKIVILSFHAVYQLNPHPSPHHETLTC